jgi:hypothetical protein
VKKQVSSVENLQQLVANDTALQEQLKNDPVKALDQFASVLDTDKWIYRVVVSCLGLAILAIIAGVIILMLRPLGTTDDKIPTVLTALGSAAIGALAGLLAPSPKQN